MRVINSNSSNCKDCYRCLRECPVKAINYKNNQAIVNEKECILCGKCTLICPQKVQVPANDLSNLKQLLNSGKKVIASVAPAFISDFEVESFDNFKSMLIDAGFYDAVETIVGARLVNKEYEQILQNSNDLLISTACPVAINYITKYYPDLIKYLAPVVSPMVAHAKVIKNEHPDAYVVFIGPCLAKKDEITWEETIVDLAVTFTELEQLFLEKNINLLEKNKTDATNEYSKIRLYPTSGGVVKSLNNKLDDVTYINIDGLDNIKNMFEEIKKGKYQDTFIEISACNGSCIGGPGKITHGNYLESITRLKEYVRRRPDTDYNPPVGTFNLNRTFEKNIPHKLEPSDYEIRQILKQVGKENINQELNCGACGFNTCREKAIAVYNGNAELTMCLPFMKDRSESLSGIIINNSPNAIVSFDGELRLQAINPAGYEYLEIPQNLSIANIDMKKYIDLYDYELMISGAVSKEFVKKKITIERLNKYFDLSIVYVKDMDFIFGIYKDITDTETKEKFLQEARKNTIITANELIDKQMRSVQEIASLLGETVAETKIALTNLKKVMDNPNE